MDILYIKLSKPQCKHVRFNTVNVIAKYDRKINCEVVSFGYNVVQNTEKVKR
jgi:hypothetical protein